MDRFKNNYDDKAQNELKLIWSNKHAEFKVLGTTSILQIEGESDLIWRIIEELKTGICYSISCWRGMIKMGYKREGYRKTSQCVFSKRIDNVWLVLNGDEFINEELRTYYRDAKSPK